MRSLRSVLTDIYSWFFFIGMLGGFAEALILLAGLLICGWAWLLLIPLTVVLIGACVWLDQSSFKSVAQGILDWIDEVEDDDN